MVMDQTSVEKKKVDVSSTFIKNILRSGLILVSSNDIITIKIDKKIVLNLMNDVIVANKNRSLILKLN